MHLRQDPDGFYACPDHYSGLRGAWKRTLWRLGYDPLTIRQRLAQVDVERQHWKERFAEMERLADELEAAIRASQHSALCAAVYDPEYDCTCPKRLVADGT